ncbi:MAG TPA: ABC transporter ATP-binding protein [Thermodesulfovibrionales bacterium]|jgi:branched-chain amino acid transport system ATP-binding protein|nr:ABC transporter ATP-binding protein [Thermodesulfovibrionales bacterium]HZV47748.1 ABC transporter ATP-binding protein [Thermodesulfovibrionales bacterium]
MLKLKNIHTFYGPIEALKGVDIEIRQGEIVCIIGNNGAGKSTTLMTISGILKPRSGTIDFAEERITGVPPYRIVRMGISQVPEGRRIFPKLTVKENLEMGAFPIRGDKKASLEFVYNLFPVLKDRHMQLGGTLSGGEQQMLAIGRALMSRPKLLLLDEPSLGLAPIIASKIFKTIREINREGVTVLLVEQNARAAMKLSGRGYVLENGRVALEGTSEDLLSDEQVRKAYLGE